MVKAVVTSAVAAILGGVFIGSAQAQDSDKGTLKVEKPIRIKIGGFFPSEGDSDTLFHAGIAYDIAKTKATNPLVYGAFLDYYGKDGNSLFGLGGTIRGYFTPAVAMTRFYGGVGLGAYFADSDGGGNETNFGGKLFAGVELNQGFFGEVDYVYPGTNRAAGIGASVGYRF